MEETEEVVEQTRPDDGEKRRKTCRVFTHSLVSSSPRVECPRRESAKPAPGKTGGRDFPVAKFQRGGKSSGTNDAVAPLSHKQILDILDYFKTRLDLTTSLYIIFKYYYC